LKESEQRAAEMATINQVSQALVSQIETEALIQLAGEQIRDTFKADIAYIALLDRTAGLIAFLIIMARPSRRSHSVKGWQARSSRPASPC